MNWIERLNREAAGRIALGNGLTVEVLHWAYAPHLPDNILHRHTYFEVCLVGAWGSGQFRVGGGKGAAAQSEHAISPGNLFIARPGIVHQIVNVSSSINMELLWLSFHVPMTSSRTAKESSPLGSLFDAFSRAADVLVVPAEGAAGVAAIWNALRITASASETVDVASKAGVAQIVALTTALLIAIAQAGGGEVKTDAFVSPQRTAQTESDRLAERAVRYIHQHLSRALSVREVAEYLAVSPRHLTRLLSAYTGVAPQAYVEQARLDRARTLLLRTDDPIKQVALLAGYRDVAHFTRAFSRRFGCPPGMFRQTGGKADKTPRGDGMKTPGALV